LVGWQVEECKVVYVPFDADWCRQMVVMLASVIAAAIPLRGQGQRFRSCQAMTNLCSAQKNAVVFSKSCAALEVWKEQWMLVGYDALQTKIEWETCIAFILLTVVFGQFCYIL